MNRVFLFCCCLLAGAALHAQPGQIKFNLVEGVGEISLGKINSIVQDQEGYMWFADMDNNCITRFDGYSMRSYRYDAANPYGPGGSYPEALLADPKGYIWVGYYGMGLDRFDPRTGTFDHYRHRPGDRNSIASDTINVLAMDRSGLLWIGTSNGLDLMDPEKDIIQHFRYDPSKAGSLYGNNVRGLCIDQQGRIWAGTGFAWGDGKISGLNLFNPSTQQFSRYLEGEKIRAIREDSQGNLWVGARGNKLFRFDSAANSFIQVDALPPPASEFDHVTFIQEDGAGALWIGTLESGILRYDVATGTTQPFGNGAGLLENSGWMAFTSREGVLWFSTQSANLYRMDPLKKSFTFLVVDGGDVLSVESPADSTIWVGNEKGIWQFQENQKKKFLSLPWETNRGSRQVHNCQLFARKGGNNLALLNGSVYRFGFDDMKLQALYEGQDPALSILPKGAGSFWMATSGGLFLFTEKNNRKEAIAGDDFHAQQLFPEAGGRIWAAGNAGEGLALLDAEGRLLQKFAPGKTIQCLYEDHLGILWAGTPSGLIWKQAGAADFKPFHLQGSPIGSTDIKGIIEDEHGFIWVSAKAGIFQISKERNRIKGFGTNQGIDPAGLTNAIYRLRKGKVIVGAHDGFYSFQTQNESFRILPPQIILRDLRVAGEQVIGIDKTDGIKLRYDQDIFSIGFAGIHYSNPNENTHLYKLEGYDNDWRRAGAERTAYYFNLPPGKYLFRVKVGNNDDVWAEHTVPIEIIPAWWSSAYFKIAAALALALLFYLIIRWRFRMQFRRQMEKTQTEQQLSELKRRSSELEMLALRSQMNPHFIFNSLNSINRFILQNNKSQASEYLTKFSRLIRFILQNSEQPRITLDRELQALELYLELEAVRFDHHFAYTITVDPFLDPGAVMVPPLIIQPYAENAIWHGLMHKEEKGLLEIELRRKGRFLWCIIRDDGIGRQKATELKSKSANTHKSLGMHITANRIELLQQDAQAARVHINDLTWPDGTAAGTEVILQIPLHHD